MAKVTGPLFSIDATGQYGGALVFAKWKGRNYVRQLVTPANPQSSDQVTARNRMRVLGAIQKWMNAETEVNAGLTLRDKAEIAAITPSGYAWNGYLVEQAIGSNGTTYDAARAAYTALQSGEKTAWVNAAGGLNVPILAVAQGQAGGGYGSDMTAGEVFFISQYALSVLGLISTPGATPTVYA